MHTVEPYQIVMMLFAARGSVGAICNRHALPTAIIRQDSGKGNSRLRGSLPHSAMCRDMQERKVIVHLLSRLVRIAGSGP